MSLRLLVIAAFLGEPGAKKMAVNAAGERIFIPERFRDVVEDGSYVLTGDRHYDKSFAEGDDTDNPEAFTGPGFDRTEVTYTGSLKDCIKAQNEDKLLLRVSETMLDSISEEMLAEMGQAKPARKVQAAVNAEPQLG